MKSIYDEGGSKIEKTSDVLNEQTLTVVFTNVVNYLVNFFVK